MLARELEHFMGPLIGGTIMRRVVIAATLLSLTLVGSASAQVAAANPGSAPYGLAAWDYNYCPAGYTPVTPPGTLSPAITGVGYCAPLATPVAFVAPRRAVSRVAYRYPHRVMARRAAYRTVAAHRRAYRHVGSGRAALMGAWSPRMAARWP